MTLPIEYTKWFREPALTSGRGYEHHPLLVAEKIAANYRSDLIFSYSRYQIAQPGLQGAAPRSDVHWVRARDLTLDWLLGRLAHLGPDEEMAWHSRVECEGAHFHIPMIDFVNHPALLDLYEIGARISKEMGLGGAFAFFETGQSFHGYLPELIPERALSRYLEDVPPVVEG